jgi:hypothetical protein
MTIETFWTVLATLLTALGSTSAWAYYERRYRHKEKLENFMKDECRERIAKMEALLERSASEKDEMRGTILSLTSQVAELSVKVQYLESENEDLHKLLRKKKSLEE